ncbi:MAG: bifunctional glycosyltransferase family 2/GtrA family protein [Clostridia bacterium]|nr:bifunctional glycosyltransferase family 2/GtrA family protein [Clostridia bacterium]
MIDDVCLIVPAYNPDEKLFLEFLDKATQKFSNIIVINDGSDEEHIKTFQKISEQHSQIKFMKHNVNLGKGRALKTAFNFYLNEYPDCIGIVQADCDGQHDINDVVQCAETLRDNKECLILGVRDFSSEDIPRKSKYGNNITKLVFRLFIGIKISDTQTGLRAVGNDLLRQFMSTKGERYEYETNILIECKEKNIEIKEVPIKTIYIDKNQTSKFNPIKDSLMIYKLFGKYIFSSLSAFVIDIILFSVFIKIFTNINFDDKTKILLATILARIISSLYNFKINAKIVFKNMTKSSYIKYATLVLIQMFVSAFGVTYISRLIGIDLTWIKVVVDMVIFMVNFVVQREVVFKKK